MLIDPQLSVPMNFTTQAAQDILIKIEHDPVEVRHWRQLLILCFDQKSIDTLQTLQVVVAAIEQIWTQRRQRAKDAYDEARVKQRSTGSKEPLPSTSVHTIPLNMRQKETLIKLSKVPQSPILLYRLGTYLEEEFKLPSSALALYERAISLSPEELQLEEKLAEGIKRVRDQIDHAAPQKRAAVPELGVIAPEMMGVKSPSHHRPSAAALIKRTGRLSVDRGRIQLGQNVLTDTGWPETQKKLDDAMSRLLTRTANICDTSPRPMRLPRSIAPSQWLEFLEGHVALLLSTLEAQDISIPTTINLEDASRMDVAARTTLVLSLMEEIEQGLANLQAAPPPKVATVKADSQSAIARLEDIFEWIEAGALSEAEAHLREIGDDSQPKEQLGEVWFHLGFAFQNNHENKRAMVAYQRAREINPENLQAWFNSGMIQHEEGLLHPALQCYLKAMELDPSQSKIWCNLGALQFQMGEFQHSVDSLNRAVGLKPDYARAWDNLAGSLCALDQLEEAERCCHRAINYKPDYADPYFKLGTIYFQAGRMEDAERAFRKTLEANPGYPLAGHYLAVVLARTHRLEAAQEVCETAATPQGETELPSLAWTELGFNLYERGDYDEAIRAYEKALTFTPERASIWVDAGVAYHQLGALEKARHHYEQAVDLDPGLARAWHNLGAVRQELGDLAGGQQAMEEAERLLARGR